MFSSLPAKEDVSADLAALKRKGVSARQVKTGKKFARRRKDFTKPRCSEPRTGFTDARGAARFRAKSRGFEKSIGVTCEQDFITAILSGFDSNRFFRDIAKWMRRRTYRLRFFII